MRTLIAVFFLLMAGCGLELNHSEKHESKEINGKTPEDYYNQFLYRQEGKYYRFLVSSTVALTSNREKFVSLDVFLMNDHTYTAKYEELKKDSDSGSITSYSSTYEKSLRGTWRVDDMSLKLSGDLSGTGNGLNYNNAEAVVFKADSDIHTPGLAQTQLILIFGSSTKGL